MQKNDAALVRQVLAGDTSAYENLVDTHKGRVFALVVGRIGNFSSAEDVVQNAFVEAYVHLKSLQSPEKFAGWLRGIAVNLSNKWLQRQHASVPIDTVDNEVSQKSVAALPDEVFEVGQTKEAVLKAVEGLPDIYREAVLLHYMEGMTYPEMATFLEVPESTVTGRLQVARNRLRDDLMPLVGEALQEKRPTSKLTRKVMSALPLMLYATTTEATLLAKLKGSKMLNMIGFLCAGVIGTGVYFGGIETVIDWRAQQNAVEDVKFEFAEEEVVFDQTILAAAGQTGGSVSTSSAGVAKEEKKKAPGYIRVKGKAEDPIVSFSYTVPDSAHVEMRVYDGAGDVIATPVFEPQKAGDYTVAFDKSDLPRGSYQAELRWNHERIRPNMYKFYHNPNGQPFTDSKEEHKHLQDILQGRTPKEGETSFEQLQKFKKEYSQFMAQTYLRSWMITVAIQDSTVDSLTIHNLIDSTLAVYDQSPVHENIARAMFYSGRFLDTGVYHAKQASNKYQDRPPQYRAGTRFQALAILGQLQFKQGKYHEAKKSLSQALEAYQEIPVYNSLVKNRWDKKIRETLDKIISE
ncbi:MAG: sigma-70 family RNA polymerase sigma factor [Candidatus Latescibacterota bacterium]